MTVYFYYPRSENNNSEEEHKSDIMPNYEMFLKFNGANVPFYISK